MWRAPCRRLRRRTRRFRTPRPRAWPPTARRVAKNSSGSSPLPLPPDGVSPPVNRDPQPPLSPARLILPFPEATCAGRSSSRGEAPRGRDRETLARRADVESRPAPGRWLGCMGRRVDGDGERRVGPGGRTTDDSGITSHPRGRAPEGAAARTARAGRADRRAGNLLSVVACHAARWTERAPRLAVSWLAACSPGSIRAPSGRSRAAARRASVSPPSGPTFRRAG